MSCFSFPDEFVKFLPHLPFPQKSLESLLALHYNHGVIRGRMDIFTKLNLPMQKQSAVLYLSMCWSPPHRDSLENIVVRGFPKDMRPCFTTAAAVTGVTPLKFPVAPLRCCKEPWGHQSPRKPHHVHFMIISHG